MTRIIFLVISLVSWGPAVLCQQPDTSFYSNTSILNKLYQTLADHYVEAVNKDTVMQNTVNGMLRRLDPWTYFMSKKMVDDQNAEMTKKFGGVGITMREVDAEIVVTKVLKDMPADKAGLRASDILVSANGRSLKGMKTSAVSDILRGDPGTKVNIVYKRPGVASNMTTAVTREIISVSSVQYYGMLDDRIGYIYLDAMTTGSGQDVKEALLDLKTKPGLQALVLDLRDNWGGYVQEAFDIASLFLNKGAKTARIMGRTTDISYYTRYDPVDLNIPLVLLVGRNTASAAEILAGVLQDHDRAVLIGERTYGKAMVQEVFDLGNGSKANMTVAHYYTPSGRCIQVRSYKDGYGKIIEDSMHKIFKTKNGRPVKSHNAISPDITIDLRTLPVLASAAARQNHFYKFAAAYRAAHPHIDPPAEFKLPDSEFEEFYESLVRANFPAQTEADQILDYWKQHAKKEGEWNELEPAYELFKQSIEDWKKKELAAQKQNVRNWLEREICSMYYGDAGYIQAAIRNDPITLKAKEVLHNRTMYHNILK